MSVSGSNHEEERAGRALKDGRSGLGGQVYFSKGKQYQQHHQYSLSEEHTALFPRQRTVQGAGRVLLVPFICEPREERQKETGTVN